MKSLERNEEKGIFKINLNDKIEAKLSQTGNRTLGRKQSKGKKF